jgi:peptidoglycan hydrolase-like protein with peptidoglycan-binding domain/tetratricopeptide (TPR) repeat protein
MLLLGPKLDVVSSNRGGFERKLGMRANHLLLQFFGLVATADGVDSNAALAGTTASSTTESRDASASPARVGTSSASEADPWSLVDATRTIVDSRLLRRAVATAAPGRSLTRTSGPPVIGSPAFGECVGHAPPDPSLADSSGWVATQVCAARCSSAPPKARRSTATRRLATPPMTRAAATGVHVTRPHSTEPVATQSRATSLVATRSVATKPVATQSIGAPSAPVPLVNRRPRLIRPLASAARWLKPGGFRPPRKASTATRWTLAISVLALGFPAAALGAGPGRSDTTSAANQARGALPRASYGHSVLAFGSGYGSGGGSSPVRVLQRDLEMAAYPPGHIDGLFGPRTRQAVVAFQAAHGLQVDGVVGPRTWAALSKPVLVLGPGAGDQPGGETVVRSLQRRLASGDDSPGPIDGRYGVLTEGAVRRFQRAHGLPVTGIAGPRTLARVATPEPSVRRSNPLPQKPGRSTRRSNVSPRPPVATVAPVPLERPASAARPLPRGSARRPHSGGVPWMLILGGLALALALIIIARLLIASPRRATRRTASRSVVAEAARGNEIHTNGHRAEAGEAGVGNGTNGRPPRGRADDSPEPAETAGAFDLGQQFAGHGGVVEAHAASGRADERGHGTAASNLGRLLEEQGALAEAEAAYRRADERGDAEGAFGLGVLLRQRGALDEAAAAYGRASGRGHNAAAVELGVLLVEQGALAEAEAAFRRADERGDADAAFNLGVLLQNRWRVAEAEAAYRRADERGDAEGAFALAVLLRQRGALDEAAAAYDRASGRGHDAAAVELGVLFAEHGAPAEAEAAFRRADERGDAAAAFNLGILFEDRGALAEAEAAYVRAWQRGDDELADMARAVLLDLGHQMEETSAPPAKRAHHA